MTREPDLVLRTDTYRTAIGGAIRVVPVEEDRADEEHQHGDGAADTASHCLFCYFAPLVFTRAL